MSDLENPSAATQSSPPQGQPQISDPELDAQLSNFRLIGPDDSAVCRRSTISTRSSTRPTTSGLGTGEAEDLGRQLEELRELTSDLKVRIDRFSLSDFDDSADALEASDPSNDAERGGDDESDSGSEIQDD